VKQHDPDDGQAAQEVQSRQSIRIVQVEPNMQRRVVAGLLNA